MLAIGARTGTHGKVVFGARMTEDQKLSWHIRTPDQRLRVFVSSTLTELADERAAVERAITTLRLIPVMFELGARPHPPQDLYRAYLEQSDIFIGLYWQRYGWVGPGMQISGLEDELQRSTSLPRLLYVKTPAPDREPALAAMLDGLQTEATASYRSFRTPRELGRLVRDDLAVLLSERFDRDHVTGVPTERPRPTRVATFDDQTQVPARLTSSMAPSFVGREKEVDQLLTAWRAVDVAGERRVMLLSGEPGIGKTTLAARLAQEVHDGGALVLYGRNDEDLGIPYQPWVEALTQLVAQTPDALLDEHVAEHGGQLARLVPEIGRRTTAETTSVRDAESERLVLFGCVIDLLARVSSERPVLLVLDDLHWADLPSVQLLRHVLMAGVPLRVAVLGTFRDSEVGADHPLAELLAKLHREPGVDRILLRGLTDVDVLELLGRLGGHDVAAEGIAVRDAVLAETGGNPFFVGEILRHLTETGTIHWDELGQWTGSFDLRAAGLPVSVKEVVSRRLAGLGAEMQRVLALAAVIGRDFDVPLLAVVTKTDDDTVIDLCDAAVAAAVLQTTDDVDRYTFSHALIEHTLYDELSPARRARAHRAVAEALELGEGIHPGARVGELAHHWSLAQPADDTKAMRYAQLAGDRALEQLAPDEALRWYSQALDLVERTAHADRRQHTEILIGLGEAQRQSGLAEHRETLLRGAWEADGIDATDLFVRAALANSRGWESVVGDVDRERIAVIDRALTRLDGRDSAARARLLALATVERLYDADLDDRIEMGREAVATARRSGDDSALIFVLHVVCQATRAPHTLEQRVAWVEEACDLAERAGNRWTQLTARAERMLTAMERGDLTTLRAEIAFARMVYETHPDPQSLWANTFQDVWCAILSGDLALAERLNDTALELGTASGQPDAMTIYSGQFTNIRYLQGRLDELIPLIEQAIVDAPGLPVYRAVLAMACGRSGQVERTTELLDEAVATGLAMPVDNAWTTAYAAWAEAAVQVAHRAAAQIVRDELAPFHDHVVTTHVTFQPAVAHYLGRLDHLLGRFDEANAWFTEAMALHERLESPVLIAHTRAAWAAMLADRGTSDDNARAVEMAEQAEAAAAAGSFGYVAIDAAAVLEQLNPSSR
jgi:tetratricopeptide (TPR) repeat protein